MWLFWFQIRLPGLTGRCSGSVRVFWSCGKENTGASLSGREAGAGIEAEAGAEIEVGTKVKVEGQKPIHAIPVGVTPVGEVVAAAAVGAEVAMVTTRGVVADTLHWTLFYRGRAV